MTRDLNDRGDGQSPTTCEQGFVGQGYVATVKDQ